MAEKRLQSKAQMRNLAQYRNLSDEEFDEMYENLSIDRSLGSGSFADFEERVKKKTEEFSLDYDLEDLKINDREALRSLVQSIISLEDYEQTMYDMRSNIDITSGNIAVFDRIQKVMSDLRKDISNLQNDLNITRKIRKSDKESSVINYLTDLKDKARIFYESKASYVFCPQCSMLLGTTWDLYPDMDNKHTYICNRPMDDGSKCGHKFTVTSSELLKNRGTNKPDVTPESML